MKQAYCVTCQHWAWVGTYLYRCAGCLDAWYDQRAARPVHARTPERSP